MSTKVKLEMNYAIMKPFVLPWSQVSPLGTTGLEFHLSPDLSILIDGLVNGEQEITISQLIIYKMDKREDVDGIALDPVFEQEYLPAKSKERTKKHFQNPEVSCFFTPPQMDEMQKIFTSHCFISHDVKVSYKGGIVGDIHMLPEKEFNLVSEHFDELNVKFQFDWKQTKLEIEENYSQSIKENAASAANKNETSVKEKLKNKGMMKKIARAVGSTLAGVGMFVMRTKFSAMPGWFKLLGVVIGAVGVAFELFGRHELSQIIRMLNSDSTYGGGFR